MKVFFNFFNPSRFKTSDVPVLSSVDGTQVVTRGVQLGRVECSRTTRRQLHDDPSVVSFSFQPYLDQTQTKVINTINPTTNNAGVESKENLVHEYEECIGEAICVAAENCKRNMNVLILEQIEKINFFQSRLDDLFFNDVTVWTDRNLNKDIATSRLNLFELNGKNGDAKFDVVILCDESFQNKGFDEYVGKLDVILRDGGFVLAHTEASKESVKGHIENFEHEIQSVLRENMFMEVFKKTSSDDGYVSLWRKPSLSKPKSVIHIDSGDTFAWIQTLKAEMTVSLTDGRIIWIVTDEISNGVIGMFKCLQQEPGGKNLR